MNNNATWASREKRALAMTIKKMKEAGIIDNNLNVKPNSGLSEKVAADLFQRYLDKYRKDCHNAVTVKKIGDFL